MRRIPDCPLWLGHVGDVRDLSSLHAAEIAAVVDLARSEAPAALARELVYCRFPLIDGGGNPPGLLRTAVETVASLIRADIATLVSCGAGMSRTPAVAGAALALVRGWSVWEGLAFVTQSGPVDVSPALWADVQSALA